jgi:hypothetical protein
VRNSGSSGTRHCWPNAIDAVSPSMPSGPAPAARLVLGEIPLAQRASTRQRQSSPASVSAMRRMVRWNRRMSSSDLRAAIARVGTVIAGCRGGRSPSIGTGPSGPLVQSAHERPAGSTVSPRPGTAQSEAGPSRRQRRTPSSRSRWCGTTRRRRRSGLHTGRAPWPACRTWRPRSTARPCPTPGRAS